jgi:hypothetical protein
MKCKKQAYRPKLRESVFIDRGSSNPYIPIIAAFVFFVLFASLSLWLTLRPRGRQALTSNMNRSAFQSQPNAFSRPSPPYPSSNTVTGFPIGGLSKASTLGPSPFAASSPNQQSVNSVSSRVPALTQSPLSSHLSTQQSSNSVPSRSSASASSPFSASQSSGQAGNLDASDARRLVEAWLAYKKTIFSSPYDVSSIENYIVNPGPLYSDITRSGGSVDWLRSNNSSYKYNELSIVNVSDFRQFPDRAHLTVRIFEDLELLTPTGIDRSKSGRKTQSWVYELKYNRGKWLVYDYRKDVQ